MNINQALEALDVRDDTLSLEEKNYLDEQGYLALPDILSATQVEAFCQRLAALGQAEGTAAGKEVHQEQGTLRLSDLVNKDPIFEICFTHPRVLAAMHHVLQGEFKLSSLNFRAALPGQGLQALHADWGQAVAPGDYYVCNSIWLLDDFTSENGATRLVPGSQKSGKRPQDLLPDPKASHPDEVLITGKAGTVVIFNSHTWHGGTLNQSHAPRRAMHSYFCRRDQVQQLDQAKYLRPETATRLSEAARYILAV